MQAPTARSPQHRTAAVVSACILTLLATAGCRLDAPPTRQRETADGTAKVAFDRRISSLWQRLAALDASIGSTGSSVLPRELRRSSLALVQHFHEAVRGHRAYSVEVDARSRELDLVSTEDAVRVCLERSRAIAAPAGRIAEQAALLAAHNNAVSDPAADADVLSFLEAYAQAAEVANAWKSDVMELHRQAIQPHRAAPLRVYHFHCLRATAGNAFDPLVFREASELYRAAWEQWSQRELEASRPEAAADLLLAVCRRTPEHFPDVCGRLEAVAQVCAEDPPTLDQLDRLDATFTTFSVLAGEKAEDADVWSVTRPRIASRLLLARAIRQSDPAETIRLAGRAARLAPELQPSVERVLQVAASSSARTARGEDRPEELFELYMKALATKTDEAGNVGDSKDDDWRTRTEAATEAISRGDLVAARDVLDRLASETTNDGRRREYEVLAARYYLALLDALAGSDLAAACDVCDDAIRRVPSRAELLLRCDELTLSRLRHEIDDLEKSDRPLGATAVRSLIATAAEKIRTEWGIAQSKKEIDRIESLWSARLSSETRPNDAFLVTVELARLRGSDDSRARQQGAEILWRVFNDAKRRRDRATQLDCIDVYMASCRDTSTPATLRDDYFELLEHLATSGEVEGLRRHVEAFSGMFPNDSVRAKALFQLAFGSSSAGGDPTVPGDEGEIDSPGGLPSAAQNARASGADLDGATAGVRMGWPWPLAASLACAVIGALLLGVTTLVTMTKGLVAFRWYAAVALAAGLALGFLFGAGAP